MIIHNGMVSFPAEKQLNSLGIALRYEVDTEVIVRLLDVFGYNSILPFTAGYVRGSYALAYSSWRHPSTLYIMRGKYSPLHVKRHQDAIYFSSESSHIRTALRLNNKDRIVPLAEGRRYRFSPRRVRITRFQPFTTHFTQSKDYDNDNLTQAEGVSAQWR